ncbi:MAG: proline--tRNA ligase [Candidatus Peregrinibacteria bacterium]
MRYSKLFGKTSKEVSQEIKLASHKLLYQGGFIRESVAGRYYFLPLGIRVHEKIMRIVEEEMDKAGAQKLITPVLHPLELWEETNRTNSVGFELMTIADQRGAKFALGGTAEEMIVDLVRKFTLSYKDLPFNVYQFSPKFRDEKRARGGLLRVREFVMKDAYSFHADEADFKKEYQSMWETYTRIFKRVGLDTIPVESDNGYIGGDYCHEFIVESDAGESRFFTTEDGRHAAHEDVAVFKKENKNVGEPLQKLKVVDAVRGTTMEEGVKLHKLPLWQQIKDVLFVDEKGRYILAIIRGDFDVNETKLKKVTGAVELRHATDEEIRRDLKSEPGFISPIGIKDNIAKGKQLVLVADDSLRTIVNAYGGANQLNKDSLNINMDRDYKPDKEADIALACEGHMALSGKKLVEKKGIEVGNIFQLGTHYSSRMAKAVFTDQNGQLKPYYMGCYGIGIGRTMGAIVEIHHDDKGVIWPKSVAPYQVHLTSLPGGEKEADKLYDQLLEAGMEVFYDDRDERAGVKFADADLIGIPLRLVISERTLKNKAVEWKERAQKESKEVKLNEIVKEVKKFYT